MTKANDNNRKLMVITLFILAIVTLIPMSTAREISMLGYRAVCSFSPVSSLVLAGFGALVLYFMRKNPRSGGN